MVKELEGYQFEHIHSKHGKDFMFGELEHYVQDQINDKNFEETEEHYVVECPYCKNAYKHDHTYKGVPYTKKKLYVLKDFSQGFCFRCDQGFIDAGHEDEIKLHVDAPTSVTLLKDFEVDVLHGERWDIDNFQDFEQSDEIGYNYLITKRHSYFKKLANPLGIRYVNHNPVIPFYYKGQLIYYQIKLAFGEHRIKYFSPPIQHKPPYIIEHGSNKKFIICEGTFDAISLLIQAPSYTPFAVLGSTITDYQLAMLRTYVPEKILVYMDETQLSLKVADRLSQWLNYADIHIIPSNGMDPEEKLKLKIANEDQVSWIE